MGYLILFATASLIATYAVVVGRMIHRSKGSNLRVKSWLQTGGAGGES